MKWPAFNYVWDAVDISIADKAEVLNQRAQDGWTLFQIDGGWAYFYRMRPRDVGE